MTKTCFFRQRRFSAETTLASSSATCTATGKTKGSSVANWQQHLKFRHSTAAALSSTRVLSTLCSLASTLKYTSWKSKNLSLLKSFTLRSQFYSKRTWLWTMHSTASLKTESLRRSEWRSLTCLSGNLCLCSNSLCQLLAKRLSFATINLSN